MAEHRMETRSPESIADIRELRRQFAVAIVTGIMAGRTPHSGVGYAWLDGQMNSIWARASELAAAEPRV